MDKLKCQRCQHEWFPRVTYVKECPTCKSRLWNIIDVHKEASEEILEDNKETEETPKEDNVLEIENISEEIQEEPEIEMFVCPECKSSVGKYQDCKNCGAELIWLE